MPSKYTIKNQQSAHFITFATVQWVDVFTRPHYKNIIVESLKYCQQNKGLLLHAYVIMTNHIHLIASANEGYNLSDIIRDFKKHTSKQLLKAIDDSSES